MLVKTIANNIADTDEFHETYPSFLTNQEFASNFLGNVLGDNVTSDVMSASVRTATDLLNSGMTRGELAFELVFFLENVAYSLARSEIEDHPASDDLGTAALALIERIDAATGSARASANPNNLY